MNNVTINSFLGMNNHSGKVDYANHTAEPLNIVDAIPTLDGSLDVRAGSELIIPLEKCYNLWKSPASGLVFAIVADQLCIINLNNLTSTPILEVPETTDKVFYVNIGNVDYCGNRYWLAAIENGVARVMGQSITDLQAMNWQATDDGLVLFLKDASGQETAYAHPGEFAHAPANMNFLCYGHGMLWGGRGKEAFYSYPGLYEWWEDAENFFEFPTTLRMIWPVSSGVFFGLEDQVIFYAGTDPDKMTAETVSYVGVKRNSLVIAPKIAKMPADTPTWMTVDGEIVAGMPDGSIVELTKERVQVTPASNGASGVIKINGVDTLLYSIEE